VCKEDVMISVF